MPDFGGFYHDSARDKAGPDISLRDLDSDGDLDLFSRTTSTCASRCCPTRPANTVRAFSAGRTCFARPAKLRFEKVTGNGLPSRRGCDTTGRNNSTNPLATPELPACPISSSPTWTTMVCRNTGRWPQFRFLGAAQRRCRRTVLAKPRRVSVRGQHQGAGLVADELELPSVARVLRRTGAGPLIATGEPRSKHAKPTRKTPRSAARAAAPTTPMPSSATSTTTAGWTSWCSNRSERPICPRDALHDVATAHSR